jgi:hypothetical protein
MPRLQSARLSPARTLAGVWFILRTVERGARPPSELSVSATLGTVVTADRSARFRFLVGWTAFGVDPATLAVDVDADADADADSGGGIEAACGGASRGVEAPAESATSSLETSLSVSLGWAGMAGFF